MSSHGDVPHRHFLPAAGDDWLLPLYDPITRWMGGEAAHRRLVEQAQLKPGQRALEIGCGTGNLTLLAKKLHPDVEVVGLDPDAKALERARQKAERQRLPIRLERGFADEIGAPGESYDVVLSALMFHHLDRDVKKRTLTEVHRVLRPGGSLHLLDFGDGHDGTDGFLARLLHRQGHLRDNSTDTVLTFMREAGFSDAAELGQQRTIFGRVFFYRAGKG